MIIDCGWYSAGTREAEATSVTEAARLSREASGFVWLAVVKPDANQCPPPKVLDHEPRQR
jgi:hypothetical protein